MPPRKLVDEDGVVLNPLEIRTTPQKQVSWPPAFQDRLNDAKKMKAGGATRNEIVAKHGSVVYRQLMYSFGLSKDNPNPGMTGLV